MDGETQIKRLPDEYINTGKGTMLAIFKLLEALAGCFGLLYVMAFPGRVTDAARGMMMSLFMAGNAQSLQLTVFETVLNAINLIAAAELVLIILDGIAGFCVRTAHKGAGLVRFCHHVWFWASILGFILLLVGTVQYMKTLIEIAQQSRKFSYGDLLSGLGSYELFLNLVLVLGGFSILTDYHRYVARGMHQVAIETKTRSIQKFKKKNRLSREAGWLSGLLAVSAVLSVVEIMASSGVVAFIADFIKPIEVFYSGSSWMNVAVTLLLALRFFLVSRCSADFDGAHLTV